jgi:hypothetical protein
MRQFLPHLVGTIFLTPESFSSSGRALVHNTFKNSGFPVRGVCVDLARTLLKYAEKPLLTLFY